MNARLARGLSGVVYVASRGILEFADRLERVGWEIFDLSVRIRPRDPAVIRVVIPAELAPLLGDVFPFPWTPGTTIEETLYEPEVPLEREFPHLWAEERERYGEFD